MPEWASTTIVVAVVLLVFAGMWASWRRRTRRDAGLTPLHGGPAGLGTPIVQASALYVATTAHEQPLERLAIAGLGFRSRGTVELYRAGVRLELTGEADVWIPASDVEGAHPSQVVIDKAVEKDGLLTLVWRVGGTTSENVPDAHCLVDSYFRITEPEKIGALYAAIRSYTPAESEV